MVSVMRFAASWRPQEAHQSISPSMLKAGNSGSSEESPLARALDIYTLGLIPGHPPRAAYFRHRPAGISRSIVPAVRACWQSDLRSPRLSATPAIVLPAFLPLPSARAQRSAAVHSPFPPRSARLPWSKNSRLSDRLVSLGAPAPARRPAGARERTLSRLTSAPCTGSLASCGC